MNGYLPVVGSPYKLDFALMWLNTCFGGQDTVDKSESKSRKKKAAKHPSRRSSDSPGNELEKQFRCLTLGVAL